MVSFEAVAKYSPLDPISPDRVERILDHLLEVVPGAAPALAADFDKNTLSVIGQITQPGVSVIPFLMAAFGAGVDVSFRTLHGAEDPLTLTI